MAAPDMGTIKPIISYLSVHNPAPYNITSIRQPKFWLDSNEFLSKSLRPNNVETFLASLALTKTSKESYF
jgi:hypothetical protein